jgi:serine/threonine protein kinase
MGLFDIFRRPEPKPQNASSPAGKQRQAVVARLDDWHPGQTLLGDFVVERVLGEGGMGKVYLVKSQTTDMRFAVKRTKGLSEGDRRNFLAELQTWIDLPEHANLVPCRFFRTVGDEVLIFAEYVEGGSLRNWIDSRKLYDGGKQKALERLLDTAIQFAWGLHCVHELGLVHQDVKPANVMMDKDAQVAVQGLKVRVTDYGLARARAAGGERHVPELGKSILVSGGGYTPAYCSPEQAGSRKLDRSTDVWSWGVSVMEMFQGGVTWQSGSVAAEALKAFLEHNGDEEHIPAMPDGVAELLNGCFRKDPAQRWKSMEAVVQKLRGVYQAAVSAEYSRALDKLEHRAVPAGGGGRTPDA